MYMNQPKILKTVYGLGEQNFIVLGDLMAPTFTKLYNKLNTSFACHDNIHIECLQFDVGMT